MQSSTKSQNAVFLLTRLVVAAIFFYAGYMKFGFWTAPPAGMPPAMVYLTQFLSIVEPLGALAILLGFLTRWAATGLAIIMVGAIIVMQFMMGVGFATPTMVGWEFPLMILAGCLVLVVFGGGSWSVDNLQASKKTQKVVL